MDPHAQKVVTMRQARFFMPRLDGIIQLNSDIEPLPVLVKIVPYMYGHGSTRIPQLNRKTPGGGILEAADRFLLRGRNHRLAVEGLRLALSVDRNCGIRVQ
jgi:hypothetical protein